MRQMKIPRARRPWPGVTSQLLYMTGRAFMRRNAGLPGVRFASSCLIQRVPDESQVTHQRPIDMTRPFAHSTPFMARGALRRPRRVLVFAPHPERGVDGAPTGALSYFYLPRLRGATAA